MEDVHFIPYSAMGLYEKMVSEQFMGELSRKENQLIWKLSSGIIVRAVPNGQFPEWYVTTSYLEGEKEIPLTHWHPAETDVYRDLCEINTGHTFWIVKKSSFFRRKNFKVPLMMDREEWQKYSEKRKSRYDLL